MGMIDYTERVSCPIASSQSAWGHLSIRHVFCCHFQDNLVISCAPLALESAHAFVKNAYFFQTLFPVMFPLLFALCEKAAVCFFDFAPGSTTVSGFETVWNLYISKHLRRSQSAKTIHSLDTLSATFPFTQEVSVDFPLNKQNDWICFSYLKADAMAVLSLLQDTTYHLQNTIVTGDVSQPVTWRWLGVKGWIT